MMVRGRSLTRMLWPSTLGDAPKRVCQNSYEMTRTGSLPGREASSGWMNLPRAGLRPNAEK